MFAIKQFFTEEARAELQRQREESATDLSNISGTDILSTSVHNMITRINEMNQQPHSPGPQTRREMYRRNMRAPASRQEYQLTPPRWKPYWRSLAFVCF